MASNSAALVAALTGLVLFLMMCALALWAVTA
jgi:hypothetical protein